MRVAPYRTPAKGLSDQPHESENHIGEEEEESQTEGDDGNGRMQLKITMVEDCKDRK